jgi:hypothetical protein
MAQTDHAVSQVAMQIKPQCLSKNNNCTDFTLSYADCPVRSDRRSKKETRAGAEAESSTREHAVSQLVTDSDDARPIRSPAYLSVVASAETEALAKVDLHSADPRAIHGTATCISDGEA